MPPMFGTLGEGFKQISPPSPPPPPPAQIKELLDECIAGPIPYCVVEVADSPFADDFSHADPHFAQLRAIGKVGCQLIGWYSPPQR